MRIKVLFSVAAGLLVMGTAPMMAQSAPAYPYATSENYCPSGLQPIVMGGVVCCGTPTRSVSYQSMMRHPVTKVRKIVRRASYAPRRAVCPVGEKGCYTR